MTQLTDEKKGGRSRVGEELQTSDTIKHGVAGPSNAHRAGVSFKLRHERGELREIPGKLEGHKQTALLQLPARQA